METFWGTDPEELQLQIKIDTAFAPDDDPEERQRVHCWGV